MNSSTRPGLLTRIHAALASPRSPYFISLLALLFSLPALGLGLMSDDHTLAWQLKSGEKPWALFQLGPADLAHARAHGAIAWWASPRLSFGFLRPLASLTHYVDFTYWPEAPWLMSLTNILLYTSCVWVAALLYRRLSASMTSAGLAGLLFAVNDANAMSVGWISGRNTLLALLGSLTTLLLHIRSQEERRGVFTVASAAVLAGTLLSAEAGLWGLCMLSAYALTKQTGPLQQRLRSLAPQLAVGLIWAAYYLGTERGVRGTSFYRELGRPLETLASGLMDLPLYVMSLFGPSVVGFALLMPIHMARLVALPVAALCLWLIWPARNSQDARFFTVCTALCALPALLTLGQDRVLVGAAFGAFGLIAVIIDNTARDTSKSHRARRNILVGFHLVLSPLSFPMNLASVRRFENGTQALVSAIQPTREVILINSPVELLSNYAFSVLDTPSRRASIHQLYAGHSELWMERVDERAIDLVATRGWGHVPLERIFCSERDMPRRGSEVVLPSFSARVLQSTQEGMPQRVRFTFQTALESSDRQWLVWKGTRPVNFTVPKRGERVRIAPLAVFEALPP